jgi:3-phenylpropionate/cinnamic acid dioxygenase small subunit
VSIAGRTDLVLSVEQFLYYEAKLQDDRRLREWLGLFTEDARYSLQVREIAEGEDSTALSAGQVSRPLVDDDLPFLTQRVKRLETRLAHSEQPPSLTRHLITNVLIESDPAADEVTAHCNLLVFQTRPDLSDHVLVGSRQDRLRPTEGSWKIAARRIVLEKSTLPRSISIFF